MRVLLRFEGHPQIGLGAIYKKESIRSFLVSLGHEPFALVSEETAPYAQELYHGKIFIIQNEFEQIKDLNLDFCLTGLIYQEAEYFKKLNSYLPVLAIEDRPTKDLSCWGVLNHSPVSQWHEAYAQVQNCWLGPEFSLLRPELLSFSRQTRRNDAIIITLGGANASGSCLRVAEVLDELGHPYQVILGPGYKGEKPPHSIVNPDNYLELIRDAKLVISQGGMTQYELIHFQTPSLVIYEDEHERELAFALQEKGACRVIGQAENFKQTDLIQAISEFKSSDWSGLSQITEEWQVDQGWQKLQTILEKLTPQASLGVASEV